MLLRRYPWLAAVLCALSGLAQARTSVANASAAPWWRHAIFYEIYPRSFADSNGDGIGDLKGIVKRLNYLKSLGIDAIWLTPCYPSPQVDFGYDVSDYRSIDPMYGTLADFDRLVAEAKKRGIRIVMDFVLNHTSDQNDWFVQSRSSRSSPYRDWYVWRDGRGPGLPPNNWLSTFGRSAWQWDQHSDRYYYHYFYPQQPDLNWRNPAVQQAMLDVTRFWYRRGVAGFRLDAVDTIYEDPALTDNPVLEGTNRYGDVNMSNVHNTKLPENMNVLYQLRSVADEYGAVLIGETSPANATELQSYYGTDKPALQMPMDFLFTRVLKLSAADYRAQIAAAEATGQWPVYVIGNHDTPRPATRYGDGRHDDAIDKVLAGLVLTLRGTPILYYGDELGMHNSDPKTRDDVKDPIGKLGWPLEKGRDGERTPMQWSAGANAGFTHGVPWLPVSSSYQTQNVSTEAAQADSVLQFYRQVLKLRHGSLALEDGSYLPLNADDTQVLSYLRRVAGESIVVVLNMSDQPQTVALDLSATSLSAKATSLISTMPIRAARVSLQQLNLEPFGVYIGRVGPTH